MDGETDILLAIREAVRTALDAAADEEIEKCREHFENEMGRMKCQIVGEMVNQIQIMASHNLPSGEYVIQIRLNGGKNGNWKAAD